ncbi:Octopamine receptor, partial [Stegodyphus mimosarum]
MVFVYCRIFVAARSRGRRLLKKTQKASSSVATKFTNDSVKEKSTTTSTSTSSRNATPQDRSKEFEAFTPVPELPKILECNVTRSELNVAPIVTVVAPEIIIENSGPVDELAIDDSVSPSTPQFQLPDNELQRVTFKDDVLQEPNNLCKLACAAKKNTEREKYYLFACEPHTQRTSLLKAPKYLKSPFGSTLAVNEMGKSDEDIIEMGEAGDMKSSGKKKRKIKVKTQREEIPIKNTATEAERYKRIIAKGKERRAVLILGLIMASFIFSWLPFFVLYVLRPLCKACEISPTGFAIAFWLGYCNSIGTGAVTRRLELQRSLPQRLLKPSDRRVK